MTGYSTVWSTRSDRAHNDTGGENELMHFVCCDDADLALCNTDVSSATWDETRATDCVVCVDMDRTKSCPRHGRCPLTRRWRTWFGRERGR
jgi:hypothetical protein